MHETYGFAAEILRRSAAGYAGTAASLLLDTEPSLREQAGALAAWKQHLTQRLLELAAALDAGEPRLFSERVVWSRKTFAARNQDESLLGISLDSLRESLTGSLPERAAGPVSDFLDAAIRQLGEPLPVVGGSELDPDDAHGRLALSYLRDVLEGESAAAIRRIADAVAGGLAIEDAYIDVLLAAQREIGRLWHANEASVAEEHLVTATTQKAMAVLAYTASRRPSNGHTMVAASVSGNAHDVGTRALADLFEIAGWRSIFLGADVPNTDLPAMLDMFAADLVSLTCTLSTQLSPARDAVALIRERAERPVKIIAGGAAFDEAPAIAAEIGADAYAPDLRSAMSLGLELLGRQ